MALNGILIPLASTPSLYIQYFMWCVEYCCTKGLIFRYTKFTKIQIYKQRKM